MDIQWRTLLWGRSRNRARRWLVFVGGYAAVAAAVTGYRLLIPHPYSPPILYEDPLITALLLGPLVVAAISGYVAGGLALGLAIGVTPALAYGLVLLGTELLSTGGLEAYLEPLYYTVASAVVGVVVGLVGFVMGTVVRRGSRELGVR